MEKDKIDRWGLWEVEGLGGFAGGEGQFFAQKTRLLYVVFPRSILIYCYTFSEGFNIIVLLFKTMEYRNSI